MFVVLKKTRIVLTLLIIGIVACASVLVWYCVSNRAESAGKEKKLPVYSVETDENVAAISFDAAWGGDKTLKILDILDEYEVKATFFLVGFWIDAFPELVKEIHNRGHLIGNHSANHPHFNTLSKEEMRKEID